MSDLELIEPQLFNTLKKTKGKRAKKYKRKVLTRKAQSTFKVKKLKLCVPAHAPPIASKITNQKQEHHFVQVQDGETSFHPSVFQGAPRRSSLISIGSDHDLSPGTSNLVQGNTRQVSMFQVNIPERGYVIAPSQNPKRRTIFEEPEYTNDGDYPMVTRTYELVRKNVVAPMWSELHVEDDQQLPMRTGEPMEANNTETAEMLSYLKDDPDDLFDDMDFEMHMNEDSTGT